MGNLTGQRIFNLRPCLFSEKQFLENYFLNFPVFVCHQKSWSTENIFRSTKNTFQSTEHFPVNGKYFPVKEKFDLVSRKVFSLLVVFVFRKVVSGKSLSKLSCVCLPLKMLINGKHFLVKGKFGLVFRKVFSWKIWAENTFRKL